MGKISKRLAAERGKVDRTQLLSVEDAFAKLKAVASAKFDETVDVAINLGVNPKHADQMVRGACVLPNGLGKQIRVLVFATGEKEKEALDAGADVVGGDELIDKIKDGWLEFDTAIAIPPMMAKVGKIGKVLGTRGLMPNPKTGTVTNDIAAAIGELKKGRTEFRADKTGVIHLAVGKVSMDAPKIAENIETFLVEMMRKKPSDAKMDFVQSVSVSSTMGPGVWVDYKVGE